MMDVGQFILIFIFLCIIAYICSRLLDFLEYYLKLKYQKELKKLTRCEKYGNDDSNNF